MRVGILLVIAALLAVGAGVLIERGSRQAAVFVGGSLVAVGLPLLALARWQLGDAFAIAPKARGLVTRGLYARIPHPMYVFVDLALLGGIILLRQAWVLVAWAVIVLAQALQARREARVLERAFGATYTDYRKRTWW